jgi:hypothetical protein
MKPNFSPVLPRPLPQIPTVAHPSRRDLLRRAACGFGGLSLAALANAAPMIPPRAKRVIFLYMSGGPSQMDTFDYKPTLQKSHGKDLPFAIPRLQEARKLGKLMASPYEFQRHGASGLWMSNIFPHLAQHADRLCMIKSMHTNGFDHGQAQIKLSTGAETLVRPSIGSWVVYGLGSENQNLPGFISICPMRSERGTRGYSNAFLPASCQGTTIGFEDLPAARSTISHLTNDRTPPGLQRRQLDLVANLNAGHLRQGGPDPLLEGVIGSFELAFRMQSEAPKLMDMAGESQATLDLYGIGRQPTDDFGRQCLMARRFAEAGVRFIQLTSTTRKVRPGTADWDQHENLKDDLAFNAASVDRPIAGLLTDLAQRGLLDDTLVWWGGEFGRTPLSQPSKGDQGRDHNPSGFTMWLAGGGVKGGFSYGHTDDFGYRAVEDKVHMHDLHATILHLLGLDHEKLTYRYAGRDFRLTDVYGSVVHPILA